MVYQSYIFEEHDPLIGPCRSKIVLHVLCSLILICVVRINVKIPYFDHKNNVLYQFASVLRFSNSKKCKIYFEK